MHLAVLPRLDRHIWLMDLSHLSALSDNDIGSRPLAAKARILHLANDVHAVNDFAEDDVLVV